MKPCPFCGSTDIVHHASTLIGRRVSCKSCYAEGPPAPYALKGHSTNETDRLRRDAAYENWNRRVSI